MVKASERVKAYHPRAPHKEGCMCAPCKTKREVGEVIAQPTGEAAPSLVTRIVNVIPPEKDPVMLGSLKTKDLFKLDGLRHRVGEITPEVIVCHQLSWVANGPAPSDNYWRVLKSKSLGTSTMVIPI